MNSLYLCSRKKKVWQLKTNIFLANVRKNKILKKKISLYISFKEILYIIHIKDLNCTFYQKLKCQKIINYEKIKPFIISFYTINYRSDDWIKKKKRKNVYIWSFPNTISSENLKLYENLIS